MPFFQNAVNTNASSGTFNDIAGNQHIHDPINSINQHNGTVVAQF